MDILDGKNDESWPVRIGAMLVAALVLAWAVGVQAAGFSWVTVADEVGKALDAVVIAAKAGDVKEAKRAHNVAYFEVFEARKLEGAIRKIQGQTHTFEVEQKFGAIRKLIGTATPEAIATAVADLTGQLRADAKELDEAKVPENVFNVQ